MLLATLGCTSVFGAFCRHTGAMFFARGANGAALVCWRLGVHERGYGMVSFSEQSLRTADTNDGHNDNSKI